MYKNNSLKVKDSNVYLEDFEYKKKLRQWFPISLLLLNKFFDNILDRMTRISVPNHNGCIEVFCLPYNTLIFNETSENIQEYLKQLEIRTDINFKRLTYLNAV